MQHNIKFFVAFIFWENRISLMQLLGERNVIRLEKK